MPAGTAQKTGQDDTPDHQDQTDEEQTEDNRHRQEIVQVFAVDQADDTRRIEAEAVHEEQADQHIKQERQGAEQIDQAGPAQPRLKRRPAAEVDPVHQIHRTQDPGIEDEKESEREIEE